MSEQTETEAVVDNQETTIETGWKNPPKLSDLQQNYDDAKIEHDAQQAKITTWLDNLNIAGSAKRTKIAGRSNIQPKLIRKQAEWRYPALTEPFLSTDDVFKVFPVTFADVKRARQNQLVLNNQFNTKINKVKFIDDLVRAGVDEGTIIVRVGWNFQERAVSEEKEVYEFVPDFSGRAAQHYMALMQLKQNSPDQYAEIVSEGIEQAIQLFLKTGRVTIPKVVGREKVTVMKTVKNHPTVEVCDSSNVIIDPSCNGDLSKAGFIIYTFETSKSELKKQAHLYKNIDKISVSSSPSPLSEPDYNVGKDINSFTFKDDARTKIVAREYWGYWDYGNTGIAEPFVATWVGNVLIRMETSPFPDGELPFVVIPHMPVRRSIYGEPDGELLIDNQKIIGAITRGMIDIMGKSAAGQTGVRKDFLDATNARKFREGKDYSFNGNVDPRIGVYQHVYPEIPQSAYNMLQIHHSDAESLSGVKAYSSGINSSSLGEVAAGMKPALDAASRRETSILRRLAYGVVLIGRKIVSLNAELLSDEEVIRITDEEFVTVRRDDLPGNYDIRLTISTAEEDAAKAQELAFMLQTTGPNGDPGEVRMIRAEIARLRKMPDLAKRIESYQPQPDPMAMQRQQMELLVLQMQLQKETSLARKHASEADLIEIQKMTEQADAILTMAKVGTEQAKTRQINSEADRTDLDYLEQESGVHQERELQKLGEQARSNTQLALVKHALDKSSDAHKAELTQQTNAHQTALDIHAEKQKPQAATA